MSELLHWVFGYFGLGLLVTVLCGAGAIAVTTFVPPPLGTSLRRALIEAAVIAFISTTIYGKGRLDEKQEWNAAIAAQISADNAAHDSAVSDVAHGVPDNQDRDQQAGGLRPVARDHVLDKK